MNEKCRSGGQIFRGNTCVSQEKLTRHGGKFAAEWGLFYWQYLNCTHLQKFVNALLLYPPQYLSPLEIYKHQWSSFIFA
jgi:hypothetical protein